MVDGILIDKPKEQVVVETIERLEQKLDGLKASLDAQMVLIRDLSKATKSTK